MMNKNKSGNAFKKRRIEMKSKSNNKYQTLHQILICLGDLGSGLSSEEANIRLSKYGISSAP
jgi:3-isopropylmalate dehydratase small subunit